jgi:hypothetical protein
MNYYAINYICGLAVSGDGSRYGNYVRFHSKADRDEWVSLGAAFRGESNYREAIKTSDPELKKLIRQACRELSMGAGEEQAYYGANITIA